MNTNTGAAWVGGRGWRIRNHPGARSVFKILRSLTMNVSIQYTLHSLKLLKKIFIHLFCCVGSSMLCVGFTRVASLVAEHRL